MPGSYYSSVTVSGTSYPVASHFVTPGISKQMWFVCGVCNQGYPRDRVRFYKGKVYGIPCGDFKDIYQLQRRERENLWKGSQSTPSGQEL